MFILAPPRPCVLVNSIALAGVAPTIATEAVIAMARAPTVFLMFFLSEVTFKVKTSEKNKIMFRLFASAIDPIIDKYCLTGVNLAVYIVQIGIEFPYSLGEFENMPSSTGVLFDEFFADALERISFLHKVGVFDESLRTVVHSHKEER